MTSPREQAIEAAAKAAYAYYTTGGKLEHSAPCIRRDWAEIASATIDAYLAARARLDGANTCPRCHGTGDDPKTKLRGPRVACRDCGGNGYRATPKEMD